MTLLAQGVWGLERWPREEAVSQVWGRGEGQCVSSILAPMVLFTPDRMRFRVLLWALGSEQKCLYLRGKGQETAVDTLSSDRASYGCPELLVQLTGHTNSTKPLVHRPVAHRDAFHPVGPIHIFSG